MKLKKTTVWSFVFVLILNLFFSTSFIYAQDDNSSANDQSVSADNLDSSGNVDDGGSSEAGPAGPASSDSISMDASSFSVSDITGGDNTASELSHNYTQALIDRLNAEYNFEQNATLENYQELSMSLDHYQGAERAAFEAWNDYQQEQVQDANTMQDVQNSVKDAVNDGKDLSTVDLSFAKDLGIDKVAGAIGASGLTPEQAGAFAQQQAIERGEGVATQMGSYQIAYSAAAGTNTTGGQVTHDAIAAAAKSLDVNDVAQDGKPSQTQTFSEAAFATAQTHNANPADVAAQLQSLGLSQKDIDTGAAKAGYSSADIDPSKAGAAQPQAASDAKDAAQAQGANNAISPGVAPATGNQTPVAPANAPAPAAPAQPEQQQSAVAEGLTTSTPQTRNSQPGEYSTTSNTVNINNSSNETVATVTQTQGTGSGNKGEGQTQIQISGVNGTGNDTISIGGPNMSLDLNTVNSQLQSYNQEHGTNYSIPAKP